MKYCQGEVFLFSLVALALWFCGCVTNPPPPPVGAAFRPEKLAEMDAAINQAIADHRCPGGVLWFEHRGRVYEKAYGKRSLVPSVEGMTEDTIFDAASLTKVIATTPAMMLLVQRGQVKLDAPVSTYIPEFTGGGRDAITVRELMTHTSGLPPDIETKSDWHGEATAIKKACAIPLMAAPGTVERYSDINFFLCGEIVQRVSGMPLEKFVKREIFKPLHMKDTEYLPPASKIGRIAPTEVVNGRPWRGTVHDPTARHMGGVAGHAGLFITAGDVARYARMLLNGGTLDGVRLFTPETVHLMTSVQTPPAIAGRRGLGWDIDSPFSGPRGKLFSLGSYGHTGWTGGSLWIDPFSQTFVLFLSNRNHPDESGNVLPLRRKLGTLAAEAITDFDFSKVPGALPPWSEPAPTNTITTAVPEAPILDGIDVLERENFAPLQGLRIGLITNHTGHDRNRTPTIDLLKNAAGVRLMALFSPEHGIRGVADEKVGDSTDAATGLPVYSLYGATFKPKPEELTNLDALVYDIQDIGCRFYTYTATLGETMEAAAENHLKYFVLDRPNPINGVTVEGPVVTNKPSFVAFHFVPVRYGMTLGELATMFKAERSPQTDLTVIRLENWHRADYFDHTGLPWTNPSPNMRSVAEATLYPGIGLLEDTLSVGRGTDTPFEVIGAPYIDDVKLAMELNSAGLPGVRFVPIRFTPTYSVHKGKECGGVNIIVTDREHCPVVDVALQIAVTLYRLYPHAFDPAKMRVLLRDTPTLEAVEAGKSLAEIHALWQPELARFEQRREKYLLYP